MINQCCFKITYNYVFECERSIIDGNRRLFNTSTYLKYMCVCVSNSRFALIVIECVIRVIVIVFM